MHQLRSITQYFRQSLIDAESLCPSDKDLLPALGTAKDKKVSTAYIAVDYQCWEDGYIDADLAKQLVDSKSQAIKKQLTEIEILFFPRVDLYHYEGGQGVRHKRRVLLPLAVFIRLQPTGQILPADKAPWIPRIWLSPNESNDESIGDYSRVDDFLSLNPFEGVESWSQLKQYCAELLAYTVGNSNDADSKEGAGNQQVENSEHSSLFNINIHSEYKVSKQCLLQIAPPITGAKAELIDVLEHIIDNQTSLPLYQRYCSSELPPLRDNFDLQHDIASALSHVGQMTGEFPLSPKQRNALNHFNIQQNGEILAVNGPPGTGKTTLLRSVVANLWTKAAIDETEPPLIVATSNNNQAVTNILESFAKVDEEGLEQALKGRWLPEISSYGLYCCAKNKANENNPYHYLSTPDVGCMTSWQTQEFIDKAIPFYLEKVNNWASENVSTIVRAKSILHEAMLDTKKIIKQGFDCLKTFQDNAQTLQTNYGSIEQLQQDISKADSDCKELTEKRQENKQQLDKLYALWELRSWWVKLLWWVSSVREGEIRKTSRLLNQMDVSIKSHNDNFVEDYFLTKEKYYSASISVAKAKHISMSNFMEAYQQSKQCLREWIEINKPETLFSELELDQVHEICDRVLRFRIFKLATHYWESRWLIETKEFVSSNDKDKKSSVKIIRKLNRFAKLMPCFVSTFYMLPKIFMAGSYKEGEWKSHPLFNCIDLLIIDEAGQASPEVSAVSFSLAKKALVVGDTDQIEPVWSVPASVDHANLSFSGLLNNEQNYEDYWLNSGLLASCGNVMRIAQRQSYYHQLIQLQRGLYLTEHRRCYNEIINYCNELVYAGQLEPLRGDPKHTVPWGSMSFIAVDGVSNSEGGSRSNINEAKAIANWLNQEQNKLVEYIDKLEPKLIHRSNSEKLGKSVGIITPFKKQAMMIRDELKKVGITGLTVGTVHSLQGDERLVVIFSAVYGINDKTSGKFYDRSTSMLNVAVSRAKDSFIVFGHDEVFGVGGMNTPSGILRKRLTVLK